MRILHLIPSLSGGGAERQLSYLLPELAELGHETHVAFSFEGPHKPSLSGVAMHRLSARNNYDPLLFWQLLKLIRRLKPDIIQTWIIQMDILGGLISKLYGIPWVLREPSSSQAYLAGWKSDIRSMLGSRASAIVSNSLGGDQYWSTRVPSNRRYVITNGMPIERIDKTPVSLPDGLLNCDIPLILYAGRLTAGISANKNLETFLEVVSCLKEKIKVRAVICGNGPNRHHLESLAVSMGLGDCVLFTGQLAPESVWSIMKKSAVYVSLSAFEGCPNAVIEAMLCGCNLVLSDIPAHREIVEGMCASLVDPLDINSIAFNIISLLNSDELPEQRMLKAKEPNRQRSIHAMTQNYEKVYQEIVKNY